MDIIKNSAQAIVRAVDVLKNGGLVIFPTETVYGIGADATNPAAIKKLSQYKKRPLGKPYSIAVANKDMAEEYAVLNTSAQNLYKEFLPGPITVISYGQHKVAPGVESENGTLGIRIPDYPLVLKIVENLGAPITATSANASYQKRPYKITDILDNISDKQKGLIDLIIDAGELPFREPSTVIDTTVDELAVLRQGDIKLKGKTEIFSPGPEATENIGKELFQKYEHYLGKRPIVFALEGPMGAGKTVFTKGLARAMGIEEEILSPTFNLLLSYEPKATNYKLTHIDAWKMQYPKELESLGFFEMIGNKNMVIAVEWADRVVHFLKEHVTDATVIWVKIHYGKGENERLISWGVL